MATAATTDLFDRVSDSTTTRPVITKLAAPYTIGNRTITITSATGWTLSSKIHFAIYNVTAAGLKDPTTQTDWTGTLIGTTISNMALTGGTDTINYSTAAYVELTPTAAYAKDLYDGLAVHSNPDGSLKTAAVQAALNLGAGSLNGWTALGYTPNTVVANGNHSYTCTFNTVDLTPTLSAGMRLRTTRTVPAPIQCASLNGTTQYFSKSSPAGMTFTNNFVVSAWVKLSSYPTVSGTIVSRYNNTSGWVFIVNGSGQLILAGFNGAAGNTRQIISYQSIPLNKWVHVTAQLDMSTFTATPTTCYVMIDCVDVPAYTGQNGTNPTSLIQAGNLEIGSQNGGTQPFSGKIDQVAVYSAKVTQATILASMNQTLVGTETSLISAYSLSNTSNDLNTTNANNLTSNGSATTTSPDSPFCNSGANTTDDFAIISSKPVFSTNTTVVVQVPEGCTIPTSGGVASMVYSSQGVPFGFPKQKGKWSIISTYLARTSAMNASTTTWYNQGQQITLPIGEWQLMHNTPVQVTNGVSTPGLCATIGLGTTTSSADLDTCSITPASGSSLVEMDGFATKSTSKSLPTQTIYYLNSRPTVVNTTMFIGNGANTATTDIIAENSYL